MIDTVWTFRTKQFRIVLKIQDYGYYQYDGNDEDGETQRKLDNGEYVAFDSYVIVYFNGVEVGRDYLGASVYDSSKITDFWTAHRDPDPMNRNCSIMRAAHGEKMVIDHYFPEMVGEAVREARNFLKNVPQELF